MGEHKQFRDHFYNTFIQKEASRKDSRKGGSGQEEPKGARILGVLKFVLLQKRRENHTAQFLFCLEQKNSFVQGLHLDPAALQSENVS
jgi:hypothetical protein